MNILTGSILKISKTGNQSFYATKKDVQANEHNHLLHQEPRGSMLTAKVHVFLDSIFCTVNMVFAWNQFWLFFAVKKWIQHKMPGQLLKRKKWLLTQQDSDLVIGVSVVQDRERLGHVTTIDHLTNLLTVNGPNSLS